MAKLAKKYAARRAMGRGMFLHPQAYSGPALGALVRSKMGRRADYGRAGDFLGIGKLVSKVMKGPVGSVLKVIPGVGQVAGLVETGANLLASSGKKSKTAGPSGAPLGSGGLTSAGALTLAGGGALGGMLGGPMMGTAVDLPGFNNPLTGQQVGGGGIVPRGYRYNKSRYYIDHPMFPGSEIGQEIEPGTRLVKVRQRNPFNPRAASRAMSRLGALSHAMRSLERNLGKLAPKPRRSGSCGCKTRKRCA